MPKKNTIRKVGYDSRGSDRDVRPLSTDHLLDVEDVARILNCSVSILNKWRLLGKGPRFVRMGALVRYRPSDIHAFITARVASSTSGSEPPPAA